MGNCWFQVLVTYLFGRQFPNLQQDCSQIFVIFWVLYKKVYFLNMFWTILILLSSKQLRKDTLLIFLKRLVITWVFIKPLNPFYSLETNPNISTSYRSPLCYEMMNFFVFYWQDNWTKSCTFNSSILICQLPIGKKKI